VTRLAAPTDALAELGLQTARFTRQITALRAQMAIGERRGIEWSAYSLLFHLVNDGAMRCGTLAEVLCSDPSTVSRQATQLIEQGLVERRPDPDDGRAAQLAATAAGEAEFARLRGQRDAILAMVLSDWNTEDIESLAHLLNRFTCDLERSRPTVRQPLNPPEKP
jgi:DNA-binding MarR family transcriptional regulator